MFEFDKKKMRYLIYGNEICPKTKNKHFQGYMELHEALTFDELKKWLGDKPHWERRKMTAQQASDYCKKDGDFKEYGQISRQGQRNDIHEVVDGINQGMRYDDVAEHYPVQFVKYFKGFGELINAQARRERQLRQVAVTVLIGPSGCGKTSHVFETEEDLFTLICEKGKPLWFDGYQGQEALLIDEFCMDCIDYGFLLTLLDLYPVRLPVKGSHTIAKWKRVYITSNARLSRWYSGKGRNEMEPLMRRIHCIHNFFKKETIRITDGNLEKIPLQLPQKLRGNTIPSTCCDESSDSDSEHRFERKRKFRGWQPHKPNDDDDWKNHSHSDKGVENYNHDGH